VKKHLGSESPLEEAEKLLLLVAVSGAISVDDKVGVGHEGIRVCAISVANHSMETAQICEIVKEIIHGRLIMIMR